ncbi:MAG: FAD-dependent thymidylate synthase [Clostridiales bacterium]|nr:FAD-dependent thymidylate synthase [Clostridiales bacterium]
MRKSTATILLAHPEALRVAASAGRISTTAGSALEIFQKSDGGEKDVKLVKKVLSSGHRSVLEHQVLSVAFDGVSVMVEQFVIEFRLASYTVKSRRYVDFSEAGFVVPEGAPDGFRARMERLFALYGELLAMGVPKEDARFVLPYCFRSNFYMTLNAREFVHLVGAMTRGRGRRFPEIRMLGESLAKQFEELYPGVLDQSRFPECAEPQIPTEFCFGSASTGAAEILSSPDCGRILGEAMRFSGRLGMREALVRDARPRELELLNFVFRVENASLACVTHFARHRMQSPLYMPSADALARGNYVLPESIAEIPSARELYEGVFREEAEFAREMLKRGLRPEDICYLALSGHTADMLFSMNARELLHFMKLRICRRAQWEIRGIALQMLRLLAALEPELFSHYGASCLVDGRCPEGKLTCGRPIERSEIMGGNA